MHFFVHLKKKIYFYILIYIEGLHFFIYFYAKVTEFKYCPFIGYQS